jgi:redox-sensitive bicupin YhaK (pirin superfamily)
MSSTIISIAKLGFPWETQDPFLFCAYHRDEYPAGTEELAMPSEELQGRQIGQDFMLKDGFRMYHGSHIPGFPYHPHRGFETITINKKGFVDHSDSLGAAGRFGEGDVQWMTAGRGVQHSEMFPLINQNKPNPLEIFQVWLNLPAKSKMVDPHFTMLWKENITKLFDTDIEGRTSTIDVITGNYKEASSPTPPPDSWAGDPENGVLILTIKINAGASLTIDKAATSGVNRSLYYYKGNTLTIDNQTVQYDQKIDVNSDLDTVIRNGEEDSYLLLLQGKPINEPVAKHGPFVMNTQAEIQEAFAEYRRTEFGGWPWPEREQVHGKGKRRFALHADGTKEDKS